MYQYQIGDHRTLLDGRVEIFDGEKWFIPGQEIDWEAVASEQAMTIATLETDINELLDAIALAKAQSSRKDCDNILEEALTKYKEKK